MVLSLVSRVTIINDFPINGTRRTILIITAVSADVEMSNFPLQTAKRDVSSLSAPVAPSAAAAATASAKMTATENVDPNHAAKNPASAAAAGHKAGSPRKSAGGGKNISFSMQVGRHPTSEFRATSAFSVLESRIVFPS